MLIVPVKSASAPMQSALRGYGIGALVGLTALIGHHSAGYHHGGAPSTFTSQQIAMTIFLAAIFGRIVTTIGVQSQAQQTVSFGAVILFGNFVVHTALTLLTPLTHTHHHQEPPPFSAGWMLLAHVLAAVACALLIVSAEIAHSQILRRLLLLLRIEITLQFPSATIRFTRKKIIPRIPQLSSAFSLRGPPHVFV